MPSFTLAPLGCAPLLGLIAPGDHPGAAYLNCGVFPDGLCTATGTLTIPEANAEALLQTLQHVYTVHILCQGGDEATLPTPGF